MFNCVLTIICLIIYDVTALKIDDHNEIIHVPKELIMKRKNLTFSLSLPNKNQTKITLDVAHDHFVLSLEISLTAAIIVLIVFILFIPIFICFIKKKRIKSNNLKREIHFLKLQGDLNKRAYSFGSLVSDTEILSDLIDLEPQNGRELVQEFLGSLNQIELGTPNEIEILNKSSHAINIEVDEISDIPLIIPVVNKSSLVVNEDMDEICEIPLVNREIPFVNKVKTPKVESLKREPALRACKPVYTQNICKFFKPSKATNIK